MTNSTNEMGLITIIRTCNSNFSANLMIFFQKVNVGQMVQREVTALTHSRIWFWCRSFLPYCF